jgi:hypothetical protein
MDFKVSVSACGTIQDNQARKLDKKRIYAHVYMIINVFLLGNPNHTPMLLFVSTVNMKRNCGVPCQI